MRRPQIFTYFFWVEVSTFLINLSETNFNIGIQRSDGTLWILSPVSSEHGLKMKLIWHFTKTVPKCHTVRFCCNQKFLMIGFLWKKNGNWSVLNTFWTHWFISITISTETSFKKRQHIFLRDFCRENSTELLAHVFCLCMRFETGGKCQIVKNNYI